MSNKRTIQNKKNSQNQMSTNLFPTIIMSVVVLPVAVNISGCVPSDEEFLRFDEKVLRKEFDLPAAAKLVMIESNPKEIIREALRIEATFEFDSTDFDAYLAQTEKDHQWQLLPPSDSLLMKIFAIRRHIEWKKLSYERRGEPLPEPGSSDNPTAEQLLARNRKNLPLDVNRGLYRCLTAGNNIMKEKKVPCSEKAGDLNDYIFAVLDLDNKVLRIKVRTYY